jgi:Raf kinase inhibitor-like YbhB/YbcL family protein
MCAATRRLPSATHSVLVVLSPLAACGADAAGQAASPARSEVIEVASPSSLRLTSPAFGDGDAIPSRYGCDGANVSPRLAWRGAPDATRSFALLVTDPDARGFVHWIVVDIPATSSGLAEGASGSGAAGREGRNDFGRIGWGGPCPPSGTHHYVFDLFALSAPLGLSGTPSASDVRRALAGRVIAEARLTGTYPRRAS